MEKRKFLSAKIRDFRRKMINYFNRIREKVGAKHSEYRQKIEEKHIKYPVLGSIILASGLTLWATSGYLYYKAYTSTKPFKQDLAVYKSGMPQLILEEDLEKVLNEKGSFFSEYSAAKTRRKIYFGTAATIGKVGSLFVLTGFPLVFLKKKKKDA
jgi:hypothetical protein